MLDRKIRREIERIQVWERERVRIQVWERNIYT